VKGDRSKAGQVIDRMMEVHRAYERAGEIRGLGAAWSQLTVAMQAREREGAEELGVWGEIEIELANGYRRARSIVAAYLLGLYPKLGAEELISRGWEPPEASEAAKGGGLEVKAIDGVPIETYPFLPTRRNP
jgi:hypothetical protein